MLAESNPGENLPGRFDKMFNENSLRWIAALSFISVFLLHLIWPEHIHEQFRDSIAAVLDALFIAAFLAIVVDPVLKRGLLKEGVRNIFRYLYGYSLPREMQDFYDKTIVGTKLIRKDCQLHWKITPSPTNPNVVIAKLHASFELLNFIYEPQDYVHEVFALSETPGAEEYVEAIYCRDLTKDTYQYQKQRCDFQTGSGDSLEQEFKRGESVPLPPRAPDDRSHFQFGAIYYAEAQWPTGLDQFIIKETTSRIKVIVTVDKSLKDSSFVVIPFPQGDDRRKIPGWDSHHEEYRCSWNFPRLFVPNEVLVVRWQPWVPEHLPVTARPVISTPS